MAGKTVMPVPFLPRSRLMQRGGGGSGRGGRQSASGGLGGWVTGGRPTSPSSREGSMNTLPVAPPTTSSATMAPTAGEGHREEADTGASVRSVGRAFFDEAFLMAQAAVTREAEGRLEEAKTLYEEAIERFLLAKEYLSDKRSLNKVAVEVANLLSRAEEVTDAIHSREDPAKKEERDTEKPLIQKRHGLETAAEGSVKALQDRYARLLLGEDMSGGTFGKSSALTISNAITNLAAATFGELRRLEPPKSEATSKWNTDLTSLTDPFLRHIVERLPSKKTLADGSETDILVSVPRRDIQTTFPLLREADQRIQGLLGQFVENGFHYEKPPSVPSEEADKGFIKWWHEVAVVPKGGLSDTERARLDAALFVALETRAEMRHINDEVLGMMAIPTEFQESLLGKDPRDILRDDDLYRKLRTKDLSDEACDKILETMGIVQGSDSNNPFTALDFVNMLEKTVVACREKPTSEKKRSFINSFFGWKELPEERQILTENAQRMVTCVRKVVPITQTLLEISKIQHNRDVGQAILEAYSRVLEGRASAVAERVRGVVDADEQAKIISGVENAIATEMEPPKTPLAPVVEEEEKEDKEETGEEQKVLPAARHPSTEEVPRRRPPPSSRGGGISAKDRAERRKSMPATLKNQEARRPPTTAPRASSATSHPPSASAKPKSRPKSMAVSRNSGPRK